MEQISMNRRNFLKISAVTAVATALASTPLAMGGVYAQSAAQDLEILNYALTLEHLESRAYQIANQSGLLSGAAATYFRDFGAHEADHVTTLTSVIKDLGGTPVAAQASYNFPAFANQQEVLTFFQTVEELGAAAYLGQAPRLQAAALITAAVSIHNVEGQHAAVLSDLIGVSPSPVVATPKTMAEVLAVVTPILAANPSMPSGMPSTGRGFNVVAKAMRGK